MTSPRPKMSTAARIIAALAVVLLVSPIYFGSSPVEWPFIGRAAYALTLGYVGGAVSRAVWLINNGGVR